MIGTVWKRFFLTLGIFLLIGIQGYAKDLQRKEYTELEFDEELTWSEPKVHNFRLQNGINFYIVEDHELPLVNVQVMVRSGEFLVPEGKQGLAEITAEVMRSGGSEKYPAESLNRLLANKAANINMSFGFSSGSASMDILKEDFEELLPVFVDLLHKPKFPSEKIDLAKQKLMTDISRRNDQQAEIAFRIFKKMIYGQDHVYARVPEYSTVKSISRSDLQSFHEKAYQGANMLVGIIGDIDPDKIKSLLKKELSVFAKGNEQEIKVPAVNYKYKKGLNLVDKPDVNQSFILMGHIGGKRQNPDYAKLQVLNKILSGGFSGRLFEKVRTEMGLAYSVFGEYGCNYFYPGMFFVGLKTKTSATAKAIKVVEKELSRVQKGVSKQELEQAKDQFFNSLVFRYDEPSEFLARRMYYVYRKMPKDSFEDLVQQIREVTASDIEEIARKYLHPEKLKVLVVGKKQELVGQLEDLGKLREIDLSKGQSW